MKLGIVGLPNVGKSTLFNALTNAGAASENYPFCTIDPNVGTVPVPDERLAILGTMYDTEKIVPAFVDFVDIAGLVKGASKGEGLGNKFLSHIREVDAIIHLVRCFNEKDVIHVDGDVNPLRDIETINTELILSDIDTIQKRIDKNEKLIRSANSKEINRELNLLKEMQDYLSQGNSARTFTNEFDVKDILLLSSKPIIYVANISEDEIGSDLNSNHPIQTVKEIASKENAEFVVISAKVEQELSELKESEKKEFLEAMGLKESGLNQLIKVSYKLLKLFSFLTAGKKEVRAWTIPFGTKAPQAAGKIHTDFEKGFIRAEIVNYNDLINYGSMSAVKENGKVRIEGKDYTMQEDDVVLFRFNV